MIVMRWYFLLALFFWAIAPPVFAYQAEFPLPEHVDDYIEIPEPVDTRFYYSELKASPHAYTLVLEEPSNVYLSLLLPDIAGVDRQSTLLIVRQEARGVSEVGRVNGKKVEWTQFREPIGNDSYLRGPSIEKELLAGTYIIEVSTPDNKSKYVLVSGNSQSFNPLSYFSILADIARVKSFHDKSIIWLVESPVVYVPLSIVIVGLVVWWYRRKKNLHA